MKQVVWCAALLVACGSSSKGKPDAMPIDASPDAPGYPAFRPSVPQIVHPGGGSATVMASPTIQPVYFQSDGQQATFDAFIPAFTTSSSWAALSEYGVGTATVATSIVVTDTPPTTASDTDVATFLAGKLDGSHAEFGAVDAGTLSSKIFLVFYPSTTDLTLGGTHLCAGISGYHADATLGSSAHAQFGVVPRCGSMVDAWTGGIAYVTAAMATDPIVGGVPQGYQGYDADHSYFGQYGSEVSSAPCSAVQVGGHTAAGIWSNTSAAAYHDPCVPGSEPYFNAAPVLTDVMQGVHQVVMAKGSTRTIDVQLFSDAQTSSWNLAAACFTGQVKLTFDKTTGNNGDVVHLTLDATTAAAGGSLCSIRSSRGSQASQWLFPVTVQ